MAWGRGVAAGGEGGRGGGRDRGRGRIRGPGLRFRVSAHWVVIQRPITHLSLAKVDHKRLQAGCKLAAHGGESDASRWGREAARGED